MNIKYDKIDIIAGLKQKELNRWYDKLRVPLSRCQVPKRAASQEEHHLSNSKFTCWYKITSKLISLPGTLNWEKKILFMRNKNSKTQGYGVPFITSKRSMSLQIYKLMGFFFFENRKIAIRRRKNTVDLSTAQEAKVS